MREAHGRGTQGRPKVGFASFVHGLVVHALAAHGSLGHHLRAMSGQSLSDSAAIARRQGLGWEWFEALFAQVLQVRAQRSTHPESFFGPYRLLAIDGSQWSLRNTASILASGEAQRHSNQHAQKAAYLKWSAAVLLEAGTHQPLGVAHGADAPGQEGPEGELSIARRLLRHIPRQEDTLLLADRLYGCASFIAHVQASAGPRAQALVRVAQDKSRRAKLVEVLSDGSALVEARHCVRGSTRLAGRLLLREVRGQVWRQAPAGQPAKVTVRVPVRLWTTLLDAQKHPARELLALYAQRWEQELFFGELKRHTAREHLLRAGSLAGAQAELGALILAASLLAEQRVRAAAQVALPPVRLSLAKLGAALTQLLPVLGAAGGGLSPAQRRRLIARFLAFNAREAVIPKRRARGCPRAVRQNRSAWPRIRTRAQTDGPWHYEVLAASFP